ncbi:MAG: helix-turn-helix transcriptional regulator [Rhodospirillales bacterium]
MQQRKYARGPYRTSSKDYTVLAQSLRMARRKAWLTQQDLANLIGWPRSRIAQWETNKRNIPWAAFQSLMLNLPGLIPNDKIAVKVSARGHSTPVTSLENK